MKNVVTRFLVDEQVVDWEGHCNLNKRIQQMKFKTTKQIGR